jgi:hypothetical protein
MRLFVAEHVCLGLGKWVKYLAITLYEKQEAEMKIWIFRKSTGFVMKIY